MDAHYADADAERGGIVIRNTEEEANEERE